jgi:hypothetical protein
MNRWQFVNGYYTLYDRPEGSGRGRGTPRVVPYWGKEDGTLTSIVFAKGQFEPWASDWELNPNEQNRLSAAMRSSEMPLPGRPDECGSLVQSIIAAAFFWNARNDHVLYASEDNLFFTSFSAAARGNQPTKRDYEQWIGSFGSGNTFSGVDSGLIGGPRPVGRGGVSGRRTVGR